MAKGLVFVSVGWPNVQCMTIWDVPTPSVPTDGTVGDGRLGAPSTSGRWAPGGRFGPSGEPGPGDARPGDGGRGGDRERSALWWAQVRWWVGTLIAVVLVGFFDVAFAVIPANGPMSGAGSAWHMIGFLAALGSGIAMFWRRSHPFVVVLFCAIGALVTPMGPLGALGALTWLYVRARPQTLAWSTGLVAVATGVALWRDQQAGQYALLVMRTADGGVDQLVWWGYLMVGVLLVATAVAVGMARRYLDASRRASVAVREREADVVELRGQLDRQEERELIAREMHDTVAHHLSLVSLHAAALEVTSQDPSVPEAAREMRSSAHRALEEMRTLIASLRDSGDGGYAGAVPRLADLGRLIDDAQRAGARIYPDLVIPPVEPPAALTRAVYRIVQESLTNAIKHGQGSGVTLWVRAYPGQGVDIGVVSWMPRWGYPVSASEKAGAGAGLVGMRERAEALGGWLSAGPEGDAWAVRAGLPWKGEG